MEAEAGMRKNDSHIRTSGLVNQDEIFTHAKKSFIHIRIGNKGDGGHVEHSNASAQHGSEIWLTLSFVNTNTISIWQLIVCSYKGWS